MRPKSLRLAAGLILVAALPVPAEQLFESKGVVQVHAPAIQLDPLAPERPTDLVNELQIISSDRVLREAIDKLDLADRWKVEPDAALKRFRDMLDLEVIRGTNLIEVRVQSPKADEAQQICTMLLNVYKAHRDAQERERADHALEALQEELRLQEDGVEEKRKLFLSIVKAVGRPFEESKEPHAALQGARQAASKLATEKARIEAQLNTLLILDGEDRTRFAAELDVADNPASESYAVRNEAKLALALLANSGIAEDHPASKAQAGRVAFLSEQAEESVDNLAEAMKARQAVLAAKQADGQAAEQRRREDAVDRALEDQDYAEARADHESARRILETMKTSFAGKRATLKIPKTPVTIHEQPKAPRELDAPNE